VAKSQNLNSFCPKTRELKEKVDIKENLQRAIFMYLEDVVIASNNQEEHLEDIRDFLKVMIRYGIKLKLLKSSFRCHEIKFLGYKVSRRRRTTYIIAYILVY
jgi:hypothetical protein